VSETTSGPGGHLAENIALFGRALRAAGLPVGPGHVLDAVAATEAAGIGGKEDLRAVLEAVFVSRREQQEVFDQAFRLFFRRRALLERMMSMMMHGAPGDPERNRDVKRRVQEALAARGRAESAKPPEDRQERDTRLSVSDREIDRHKDFEQMSAAEVAAARRAIARLVMPDQAVPTRRFAPAPDGRRIDARRALREALRHGGTPLTLPRRAIRERVPPLVALIDISDSMSAYGRLFLHFMHALGVAGRDVHAFTFATGLTNVTRAIASHRDPDEALAACGRLASDWNGGTRIAAALHRFNRDWSRRVLAGGAVVLLLTDGLERSYEDGQLAREMDRLHRSCRRLIWLNPLLRYAGFEALAQGIRTMLPHVDEFRTVHSLAAMADLCAALDQRRTADPDPRRWLRRVA
jgi:hypothetical protein